MKSSNIKKILIFIRYRGFGVYPRGRVYMLRKEVELERAHRQMAEQHCRLKQDRIEKLQRQIRNLHQVSSQVNELTHTV